MSDFVSYETAVKLKEAGFPQPEFLNMQLWYRTRYKGGSLEHPAICMACKVCGQKELNMVAVDGGDSSFHGSDAVFAPTATDILRGLGEDWTLRFQKSSGKFKCTKIDGHYISPAGTWHENPAEAAALAYLELNER